MNRETRFTVEDAYRLALANDILKEVNEKLRGESRALKARIGFLQEELNNAEKRQYVIVPPEFNHQENQ